MEKNTAWHRTSAFGQKLSVFCGGGVIYSAIEVALRGFTHWTMTLTGGLCLLIMYIRYTTHPSDSLLFKCFYGMCVITFFEFTVGCIVNLLLGWNVWDYSHMYLNVLGQICPSFSGGWFLISLPVAIICGKIYPAEKNVYTITQHSQI